LICRRMSCTAGVTLAGSAGMSSTAAGRAGAAAGVAWSVFRAVDGSAAGTVRAATSGAGESCAAAELAGSPVAGARWTAGLAVTLEAASVSRPVSDWAPVGRSGVVGRASAGGRGADGVWGVWLGTSRVEKASPAVVEGAATPALGAGSAGARLVLASTRANRSAKARSGVAADSGCVSAGRSVWGRDCGAAVSVPAGGAADLSMWVTVGAEASTDWVIAAGISEGGAGAASVVRGGMRVSGEAGSDGVSRGVER
jgi:hypothetical protein